MAIATRGEVCGQCHQIHPGCLGHFQKHPEKPCNVKSIKSVAGDTGHCRYHGGKQMREKIAKKERLAKDANIARFLHQMEVEPLDNPLKALRKAVAQAKAIYEYYLDRVAQMEASEQRYESAAGIEQLRSEVALMERAQERYTKGLETLVRAERINDGTTAGETLLDLIKSGLENRP